MQFLCAHYIQHISGSVLNKLSCIFRFSTAPLSILITGSVLANFFVFSVFKYGSKQTLGKKEGHVHPTYIFPEEIKAVVRARFPDSIKEYTDPTGDQVSTCRLQYIPNIAHCILILHTAYWKYHAEVFWPHWHKSQVPVWPTDDDANQHKQVLTTMPILEDIGTINRASCFLTSSGNHTPGTCVAGLTVNN